LEWTGSLAESQEADAVAKAAIASEELTVAFSDRTDRRL
jgi:hypothetical protein